MRRFKIVKIIIFAIMSMISAVSYATQPVSNTKSNSLTTSNTASVKKGSTSVSLSFSLFQKLMNMKSSAVAQYLKQQGCKVEQCGEGIYSANVKGGDIYIYYPSYHSPRVGIGPVEFYTQDLKVLYAWYDALRNADYGVYSNDGLWSKERNVSAYPIFGVVNNLDDDSGEDYSGGCTLYLKSYPQ